jgi:4-hydroxy-tetrahydrodipicolinate synthase
MPKDERLSGTFIAMTTPFSSTGALDAEGLRANIKWWIDEGLHGLIPLGSAGEFQQLTEEERSDIVTIAVAAAGSRVPVVPGVSSDWTAEAVAWARFAEQAKAQAVMLSPPYYSLPSEDELFAHYRTVAEAIALPIMAYNNPATTGIDMKPAFIERLSAIPNVRYIKESTYDVRRVEEIHRRTKGRVQVFAGIHALESFLVGAVGWVSVPANVAPRLSSRLFDACVVGNLAEARAISGHLWDIMQFEDETGKYVQLYKAGLDLMGRPAGLPRQPRLPLTGAELERLGLCLKALSEAEAGLSATSADMRSRASTGRNSAHG